MSPWAEFQPLDLLRSLTARGIDFVLIGGYAAVLHGSPRVTQDLDICHSTEPANLNVLGETLVELGARLYGVDEEVPFVPNERTLAQVSLLTLDTSLGKLDLMAHPAGIRSYATLRAGADAYDVGGFVVRVASISDLMSMKVSAGRPKDLADLVELEAIERLRDETR